MGQFHHTLCRDCGQPIIQRGSARLNRRGTPLDHNLTCTARSQTPDSAHVAGSAQAQEETA